MKFAFSFILLTPLLVFAQTGGSYQIEKQVIASGGAASTGGNYSLESTSGQAAAGGFFRAASLSAYHGFWTPTLSPTAATVSIGGKILTAGGQGIRGARVMLTSQNGEIQFSSTGSFGFYRFNNVRVGETYVLTVFSKRFSFANPTRIVTVLEELTELHFIADP